MTNLMLDSFAGEPGGGGVQHVQGPVVSPDEMRGGGVGLEAGAIPVKQLATLYKQQFSRRDM